MKSLTFYELLSDSTTQRFILLKDLFANKKQKFYKSKFNYEWAIKQMIYGGWSKINNWQNQINNEEIIDNVLEFNLTVANDLKINHLYIKPFIKSLNWLNKNQIFMDTLVINLELDLSPKQIKNYLLYLQSIFVCFELQIWTGAFEIIKRNRLRVKPKNYLCDPSILFNVFNIDTVDKAIADPEILGYAFENQVIKDLSVYMQALGGKISFYRDENGLEVDAILELKDGRWAAIEIKFNGTQKRIGKAVKTLNRFYNKVTNLGFVKPAFMAIIVVGNEINQPYQRTDGIYVIPHACLGI